MLPPFYCSHIARRRLTVPGHPRRSAPQRNPIRNLFLILTRSSYFSMFMMANIIANFILLAAYDPLHNNVARGYGADGDAAMTSQDDAQTSLEPWFQAVRAAAQLARLARLPPPRSPRAAAAARLFAADAAATAHRSSRSRR